MSRRQRVSLCMIVRDEEHNLEACLAPVAHLFDEIMIVDTGSHDRTVEIAHRFTPHVHHFQWCDDFAAARNESLRHATGDWIFWLDADDRVLPEQVAALQQLFAQLDDQPLGYLLNTVLRPAEPSEESFLITHLRLFRRHPGIRWRGRVHEQIELDDLPVRYDRVLASPRIEHMGYQNAALTARKLRRNMRLLRMDYAVDPNNSHTLFHLGMNLRNCGRHDEAKAHLVRLFDMDLGAAESMRWVYEALVEIASLAGDQASAARYVEHGLALFPDDEYLLLARARMLYANRNYAGACQELEGIIRNPPSRFLFFGQVGNIRTKVAPRMLGAAYRMQGAYAKAEQTLRAVALAFPSDVETWFILGLLFLDQTRRDELEVVIHRLLETHGGSMNGLLLKAQWHLRHGDLAAAGRTIDELVTRHPTHWRPRLLRAEWLARSQQSPEAQLRALNDVLRIEPGNLEARYWTQKLLANSRPAAATRATIPPIASGTVVAAAGASAV